MRATECLGAGSLTSSRPKRGMALERPRAVFRTFANSKIAFFSLGTEGSLWPSPTNNTDVGFSEIPARGNPTRNGDRIFQFSPAQPSAKFRIPMSPDACGFSCEKPPQTVPGGPTFRPEIRPPPPEDNFQNLPRCWFFFSAIGCQP